MKIVKTPASRMNLSFIQMYAFLKLILMKNLSNISGIFQVILKHPTNWKNLQVDPLLKNPSFKNTLKKPQKRQALRKKLMHNYTQTLLKSPTIMNTILILMK